MPDNLMSGMGQPQLLPGYMVKLEALDPDTGAAVTGVTLSNIAITGDSLADALVDVGDDTPNTVRLIPAAA